MEKWRKTHPYDPVKAKQQRLERKREAEDWLGNIVKHVILGYDYLTASDAEALRILRSASPHQKEMLQILGDRYRKIKFTPDEECRSCGDSVVEQPSLERILRTEQ